MFIIHTAYPAWYRYTSTRGGGGGGLKEEEEEERKPTNMYISCHIAGNLAPALEFNLPATKGLYIPWRL